MDGRIMIVDSDVSFLDRVKISLSDKDVVVETFTNGFDALCRVRQQYFDMVLLGTEPSGISGIQLAALLRLSAETRDIPVFLLADGGINEEQLKAGRICCVRKWLKKNLDTGELSDSVKAVLREHLAVTKAGRFSPGLGESIV